MRQLHRATLSQPSLDKLAELTDRVKADAKPRARAKAMWKSKPKKAFDEIRTLLEAMATGRARCMYCEDSLGTDIDHFRPKADYPELAFSWPNYLLACSHCNSNLKRNEFPVDAAGEPLLLDPTVDDPAAHLVFSASTGDFVADGPKGPESIRVFGLNDDTSPRRLPTGRQQALVSLTALLKEYDREITGDPDRAAEIRATVSDFPFSAVLHWMIRIANAPSGTVVLGADVVGLIRKHEVHTWVTHGAEERSEELDAP